MDLGTDVSLESAGASHGWPPAPHGLSQRARKAMAFLENYLWRVPVSPADVIHLTSHTQAAALLIQRFNRPVVVTVFDLMVPLLRRDLKAVAGRHPAEPALYRLALAGLKRADAIIATSQYTRHALVDGIGIPAEKIHVIHPVVDRQRYRPQSVPQSFLDRYGLERAGRYVLYVGPNATRANPRALLRAFGQVKQRLPEAKLIMLGAPQPAARLPVHMDRPLQADVLSFDAVPDHDRPLFYNAAELAIAPHLHEGFGLAALEAMACGKVVVYARDGALPELVGEAGLAVSTRDELGMAAAIARLMEDQTERTCRGRLGQRRASTLGPGRQAMRTYEVYCRLMAPRRQAISQPAGD